jgi:hypothetical protein
MGDISPMIDENLYAFVARRDRELTHQIAALKGQITQLTGELAQRERELLKVREISSDLASDVGIMKARLLGLSGAGKASFVAAQPLGQRYAEMTIKELVIQALLDHFPNGGSAIEIRDFIQDAYGRDIMPSSLRPQMHRLKTDGILGQEPTDDKWNFRDGKRALYSMYDHPSSRKAMRELQDEITGGLPWEQVTEIQKSK